MARRLASLEKVTVGQFAEHHHQVQQLTLDNLTRPQQVGAATDDGRLAPAGAGLPHPLVGPHAF
jgi:hypothetical protein